MTETLGPLPASPLRTIDSMLSIMFKQYEAALASKKIHTEPQALLSDWALLIEIAQGRLRERGYVR